MRKIVFLIFDCTQFELNFFIIEPIFVAFAFFSIRAIYDFTSNTFTVLLDPVKLSQVLKVLI